MHEYATQVALDGHTPQDRANGDSCRKAARRSWSTSPTRSSSKAMPMPVLPAAQSKRAAADNNRTSGFQPDKPESNSLRTNNQPPARMPPVDDVKEDGHAHSLA